MKIRTLTIVVAASTLLAGSALPARAGGLHFRMGAFFPRADSGAANDLFADVNELYSRDFDTLEGVAASDWTGFAGGIEYTQAVAPLLELGLHFDGYGRTLDTFYRDYLDEDGRDIFQTSKLTMVPMGVSVRVIPTRREALAPYVAAGVDAIYYRYEEFGDFVDFFDPDGLVLYDSFLSDGWAFGFHAAAGVRVPLNYDWSLVGEARYQWSATEMNQDFRLNRIDLSGLTVTVGAHVRF
jgi:opacity protein-like surface antigen